MKQQRRLEQILDYLKSHNLATVGQLVAAIDASPATIRRDLIRLDGQGMITRSHGGVVLNRFIPGQPTTGEKQWRNRQQKLAIARYGASLINPGDTVILDAGTTTLALAHQITHLPLRVITTDLHIALFLAASQQIEVTITGGRIDDSSQSCIGDHGRRLLRGIYPDVAFISCNSWSLEKGITTPTEEKAGLKQDLIASARRRVLVADSSKYGAYSMYCVAPLVTLTDMITDGALATEVVRQLKVLPGNLHLA